MFGLGQFIPYELIHHDPGMRHTRKGEAIMVRSYAHGRILSTEELPTLCARFPIGRGSHIDRPYGYFERFVFHMTSRARVVNGVNGHQEKS
jgi:hypothetical protein